MQSRLKPTVRRQWSGVRPGSGILKNIYLVLAVNGLSCNVWAPS